MLSQNQGSKIVGVWVWDFLFLIKNPFLDKKDNKTQLIFVKYNKNFYLFCYVLKTQKNAKNKRKKGVEKNHFLHQKSMTKKRVEIYTFFLKLDPGFSPAKEKPKI